LCRGRGAVPFSKCGGNVGEGLLKNWGGRGEDEHVKKERRPPDAGLVGNRELLRIEGPGGKKKRGVIKARLDKSHGRTRIA